MKNVSKLTFALFGLMLFFQPFAAFAQTLPPDAARRKTYQFTGGRWFDGKGFRRATFYSVDGVLTKRKPARVDETVDLAGGFVIPPFADAHTHNLDGTFNLEKIIKDYLAEGTFYVQVLTNYASGARLAKPFLNKPESVDAVYANGGLTSTLGHPFLAYEPRAQGFFNPADWNANMEKIKLGRRGEGDVYWFFDSLADVDGKWAKFLAQKPDVVKIFLLDAENHAALSKNGNAGDKGLSPEVAQYIVEKAHRAGLKVYAHVETANDFRLGLKIGVDGFAHLPYYGWNGKTEDAPKDDLTVEDIRLAASNGAIIVPTAQLGRFEATDYSGSAPKLDAERFARIVERQKRLYNLMLKNGATLALGSDAYGRTLDGELRHFYENRIFDNLTLLRIASETTPQKIFPNRKVGRLKEGFEASFLVLDGDPVKDFAQIKNIRLRFKQGGFIK